MLKLIKHEFRKNLSIYGAMLLAFAVLEALYAGGFAADKEDLIAIAFALEAFAAFAAVVFTVFIAPVNFSRELKTKSGYLVFMTPNSAYRIIGAKLLSSLIGVGVLGIISSVLMTLNYGALSDKFGLDSIRSMMDYMLVNFDLSVGGLISFAGFMIIEIVVSCFAVSAFAILAVALSATILHRQKGRGVISVILFIVLMGLLSFISSKLPGAGATSGKDLRELLISGLPTLILDAAAAAGAWYASSWLAEHKIAL